MDYWLKAFASVPFWQLLGGYFVCGVSTSMISTHYVPYAIEEGFSPSVAATAFGLMSALNVAGALLAGVLGDRVGRKNLLALVYLMRGMGYVVLLTAPGPVGAVRVCGHSRLLVDSDGAAHYIADGRGIWAEEHRHSQRRNFHGSPDRGRAVHTVQRHHEGFDGGVHDTVRGRGPVPAVREHRQFLDTGETLLLQVCLCSGAHFHIERGGASCETVFIQNTPSGSTYL